MSKVPGFPQKSSSGQSTPPATSPFASRPTPPSPMGSLGARFGAKAMWEILPMTDMLVSFELAAITEALIKAFDLPVNAPPVDSFLSLVEKDRDFSEALRTQLDDDWQALDLRGAFLVYHWREEIRQAVNARMMAIKSPATYTLVRDPLFALNVLGRARTSLLLATAPLALDRSFITRSLVCDDTRLLNVALERAHTVEFLIEPPEDALEEEE